MNIKAMLKEERFHGGLSQILTKLNLAQTVMLIHQTDVKLILEQVGEGVQCSLLAEKAVGKILQEQFKPIQIPGIRSFAFKAEGVVKSAKKIVLEFSSENERIPLGLLILSGSSEIDQDPKLQETIPLVGYPRPIHLKQEKRRKEEFEIRKEDFKEDGRTYYPDELVEEWRSRYEST